MIKKIILVRELWKKKGKYIYVRKGLLDKGLKWCLVRSVINQKQVHEKFYLNRYRDINWNYQVELTSIQSAHRVLSMQDTVKITESITHIVPPQQ
jgi:hypothetical protein